MKKVDNITDISNIQLTHDASKNSLAISDKYSFNLKMSRNPSRKICLSTRDNTYITDPNEYSFLNDSNMKNCLSKSERDLVKSDLKIL